MSGCGNLQEFHASHDSLMCSHLQYKYMYIYICVCVAHRSPARIKKCKNGRSGWKHVSLLQSLTEEVMVLKKKRMTKATVCIESEFS